MMAEIRSEEMEKFNSELSREMSKFKEEFVGKVLALIIASMSLVVALSWDSFFEKLFEKFVHNPDSVGNQFLYALLLTLIVVAVSILMSRTYIKKHIKNAGKE